MHRLLERLDHPEAQAAAGDPCRRHQRQGFDHRLSARDPRSRGPARPRLHLALSGADQRMLSPRREAAAAGWSAMTNCARLLEHCEQVNAGEPITIFEIETAAAFCLFARASGRCRAAGSRSRRPARRHQCDRRAAGDRHHAGQHGSHRISRQLADRDRRREGRHHQARRAGDLRRAGAGSDGGDRGAGASACARRCMRPGSNGMSVSSAGGWSIRTIAA